MNNNLSNRRAVWVGIFVLVGLAFFAGGILMIGNLHETFKKKIKLVSLFDDVNGLQTGNNVWFSGVKVGTVSSIHFYDTSKVKVTVSVDVKAQEYIRKNAKIKLSTDGLIGNKILVIYGGSRRAEQIAEGDTLHVVNSISQEDMVNTLEESNRNLHAITTDIKTISNKMANGQGSVGKLLNDNALYDNVNEVAVSLQAASLRAQQLVKSLEVFSSKLNRTGTLANDLVSDTVVFKSIKSFATQLKQIGDTVKIVVTQLKQTTGNTSTVLGVISHDSLQGAQLKTILKNLNSSSKKLDEDLEAAQHSFLLRGFFRKKAKQNNHQSTK